MILSKPQAEAVYSAMCALNNVGNVRLDAFLEKQFHVREMSDGRIVVHATPITGQVEQPEIYESQAAFATAYGLNSDEPQSAVAAAAGGLTQTAIQR